MILVIGEMILKCVYWSVPTVADITSIAFAGAGKEVGAHGEYGRCVLGLLLAYLLQSVPLSAGNDPQRLILVAGCIPTTTPPARFYMP
jgi:hypothetical protein